MHYSGMAAMRLDGLIRYDAKLFLLSILVAVALATLALWIKFHLQSRQDRWYTGSSLASAAAMGLAVSGMHYTAMAAAYFIRDGGSRVADSGISPTLLASIVLASTGLIIVLIFAEAKISGNLYTLTSTNHGTGIFGSVSAMAETRRRFAGPIHHNQGSS
ncbi:MAG: hypothetical protein K8F27_03350 [Sulfuricellaceae bacterium]|nr:hypothetical protein [Sulfuricellaceae bacterium]